MKVYLGNKGRNYFIMGVEGAYREVYAFNMFGNLESTTGGVSSCDNWREVEYISLVGQGNYCEILCSSRKNRVNENMMSCVANIRGMGGYIGTIFSVPHEDELGRYNQILFVYDKGVDTLSLIKSKIPGFCN